MYLCTPNQYGQSHCGDKMILQPSYHNNRISYTGIDNLYAGVDSNSLVPGEVLHCHTHEVNSAEIQGPFSISYLEAQVTLNFSSKSLDHFLSSLRVTWKPSHLAKSQVTLVADLVISWVPLTSLVVFCIFLKIHVISYDIFYNIYTHVSQHSLHW